MKKRTFVLTLVYQVAEREAGYVVPAEEFCYTGITDAVERNGGSVVICMQEQVGTEEAAVIPRATTLAMLDEQALRELELLACSQGKTVRDFSHAGSVEEVIEDLSSDTLRNSAMRVMEAFYNRQG